MDRRPGEILDAAGVVEIEMRHDDVPHVARREAESLDLPDRGQPRVEADVVEHDEERADAPIGVAHVLQAEAGIDEDEPLVGLEEQAVTGELRGRAAADAVEYGAAERLHQSAIEVVDAQCRPSRDERERGGWTMVAGSPYSGGEAATIRRSS